MNTVITQEEMFSAFRDDALELTLLPTEQCNFRCTYCYEDFAIGRMRPDTVSGVKRFMERRIPSLRRLSINWFGGEPLLAKRTVFELGAHATELCRRNDVHHSASITTNGYLLDPETFSLLTTVSVDTAEISLDGPAEQHDTTRVTRSGLGTYERIAANLDGIKRSDLDVTVILRLHISPGNAPAYPVFLEELKTRYLDDPRFQVLFFPIEHLGGPNDDTFEILDHDRALDVIRALGEQLPASPGRAPVSGENYVCYAAKPNSLLIRADGRLGKCTVALNDPRNDIGRIHVDGTVAVDDAKHLPWIEGWWTQDRSALRCPLDSSPGLISAESLWMKPQGSR